MDQRDEVVNQQRQLAIESERLALRTKYKIVFESDDGKEVLKHLVATNNVLGPIFNKDPYMTAYLEGQRNAILKILVNLDCDLESLRNDLRNYKEKNKRLMLNGGRNAL